MIVLWMWNGYSDFFTQVVLIHNGMIILIFFTQVVLYY